MKDHMEKIGRRVTRRRALAIMGGAAFAACFSERPTETEDGEATEVAMTANLTFSPEHVTIQAGETIRWRNTSDFPHTATGDASKANDPDRVELPAGASPWDSGTVTANGTYSRRFDVPGEYRYVCLPHEEFGMIGRITVT